MPSDDISVKNIESHLYEIENILATPSINKLFKKNNINIDDFEKVIAFYIVNISVLKKYKSNVLLEILDKKLKYLVKNGQSVNRINLYYTELDTAITFIKNKKNTFFPQIKKTTQKNHIKEDIFKLDSIDIKDFFSIKNLKLENLKDKKEIYILGENGDGKTLFLQAITTALKGVEEGVIFDMLKNIQPQLKIIDSKKQIYKANKENTYKYLIAYGANRNNTYQLKEDEVGYLTLFDGSLDLENPVRWLINLEHSELRGDKNIVSLQDAKIMIRNLLHSDVEIDIVSSSEVTFKERGSFVEFEQLSAGYKGVLTIVCDMLVRLSKSQPNVTDLIEYQGVVLIDEVELHLHPKWKYDFMQKIRTYFPLIQFIVTTHSPTVILGASKEAVFYKIYKDTETGEVQISNQMNNEGYTNNSLLSSPLFDVKTITSRNYEKRVSSDDFIYEKIHKVVGQRIKENINIDEEEILKLINEELDKI